MSRHPKAPPIFPAPWAKEWGQDQYGLWMSLCYKGIDYIFRWIPPGRFMMGSPEDEKGRFNWEDLHQVTFTEGFWLGDFPVTQALYQAVMGENPSKFQQAENSTLLPVETVSWLDAQKFIATLNQAHPALNAYLPMESQWEYACRAGTDSAFWFGDSLDLSWVNYDGEWNWGEKTEWDNPEQARKQTNAKGDYPVNPWGLYDMHGNVWEWCLDPWQENLGIEPIRVTVGQDQPELQNQSLQLVAQAHQSSEEEEQEQKKQQSFVGRGGSWSYDGRRCRSAYRNRDPAGHRSDSIGFRLSLGPELQ